MAGRRPRKTDYDYYLAVKTREIVGNTISGIIKGATLIGVSYFIYLISGELAGKNTLASLGLSFLADVKTSRGVAMALITIFGASGISYGMRQRKLRRDDVQARSSHGAALEKEMDKKRSSSRLTSRGTSRKEDQS